MPSVSMERQEGHCPHPRGSPPGHMRAREKRYATLVLPVPFGPLRMYPRSMNLPVVSRLLSRDTTLSWPTTSFQALGRQEIRLVSGFIVLLGEEVEAPGTGFGRPLVPSYTRHRLHHAWQ